MDLFLDKSVYLWNVFVQYYLFISPLECLFLLLRCLSVLLDTSLSKYIVRTYFIHDIIGTVFQESMLNETTDITRLYRFGEGATGGKDSLWDIYLERVMK